MYNTFHYILKLNNENGNTNKINEYIALYDKKKL